MNRPDPKNIAKLLICVGPVLRMRRLPMREFGFLFFFVATR
jgi:hypothetical protein